MEIMTEPSTEKLVDGLSKRFDRGFEKVNADIREVRGEIRGLRAEVKAEFKDLRTEVKSEFEDVRGEFKDLRTEVKSEFEDVRGEFKDLRTEVKSEIKDLRADMNSGFARVDAKFDSLNRTVIYLLGGSLSVATSGLIAAAFHLFS
jgi:uncharacterized coiled-coil DUF342 family protein